jgi:hypothetical protein
MSMLWGKGSVASFSRALLWASAVGVPLAALGGILLLMNPAALGGGFFILLLIPLPIGLAAGLFLHGIDAILLGSVLSILFVGLAARLTVGAAGPTWMLINWEWLLAGLVAGVLVGVCIRTFVLRRRAEVEKMP